MTITKQFTKQLDQLEDTGNPELVKRAEIARLIAVPYFDMLWSRKNLTATEFGDICDSSVHAMSTMISGIAVIHLDKEGRRLFAKKFLADLKSAVNGALDEMDAIEGQG